MKIKGFWRRRAVLVATPARASVTLRIPARKRGRARRGSCGGKRRRAARAFRRVRRGPGRRRRSARHGPGAMARKAGCNLRHVAGDDQVPVRHSNGAGRSGFRRGGLRPGAGRGWRGSREPASRAPTRTGAAGRLFHLAGDRFHQGHAAERQARLVAAHPRTASAGQHVTGPCPTSSFRTSPPHTE